MTWKSIDYSFGTNIFNNTVFKAPVDGIYSFFATARYQTAGGNSIIYLRQHDGTSEKIVARGTHH